MFLGLEPGEPGFSSMCRGRAAGFQPLTRDSAWAGMRGLRPMARNPAEIHRRSSVRHDRSSGQAIYDNPRIAASQ